MLGCIRRPHPLPSWFRPLLLRPVQRGAVADAVDAELPAQPQLSHQPPQYPQRMVIPLRPQLPRHAALAEGVVVAVVEMQLRWMVLPLRRSQRQQADAVAEAVVQPRWRRWKSFRRHRRAR